MKRKLSLLLCVILLTQITGCGKRVAAISSEQQPPAASGSSSTIKDNSTVESVSEQYAVSDSTDGKDLIEVSIVRPALSSSASGKINEYYDTLYVQKKKEWNGEIAEFAKEDKNNASHTNGEFVPYTVHEDFESMLDSEKILSIKRVCEIYSGGAHGNRELACETFRKDTGERITLSVLLPNTDIKTLFLPYVNAQIDAHPDTYFEDAKALADELFDENAFYLTKDSIAVLYQPYDLAPYAVGPQIISIPLDKLQNHISSEYWEFLHG